MMLLMFGVGVNNFGQLGLGDTEPRFTPTRNDYLREIVSLAVGKNLR